MDINIEVGENRLNIRAAALIIHDGKVLMHKNLTHNTYHLIGGRVEFGESSDKTVLRELFEELGKEVEISRYVCTLENFFEYDNLKVHEYMLIYRAEFKNSTDRLSTAPLSSVEGRTDLSYEWIEIDKLNEYNVLPTVLKEIIREKDMPIHKIHYDG